MSRARHPLRVLHVVPGLERGGTERFLERLLLHLAGTQRERVHSSVVVLKGEGAIGRALRARGIPVRALEVQGIEAAVRALPHRSRVARSTHPHVIQGWLAVGNATASLVGHAFSIPVVWNERNSGGALPFTWPTAVAERLASLVPPPACVVCLSDGARRRAHAQRPDVRTHVIENGYDDTRFVFDEPSRRQLRAEHGIADDDPVLVAVQRFSPEKDPRGLLEMFAEVRAQLPRAHLLLVGEGNDEQNAQLTALIASRDRAQVHLLGPRDDVARVLSSGDVFVSASRAEGVPNALAEALLVERLAVATDVGDTRLLACDGLTLVPPSNARALVDATLRALAMSPDQRRARGRLGRARIAERFSLSTSASRYLDLWSSIGGT